MRVVWTTQLGGRTGCTPQSMLVAEKLRERDIDVALMHTPPLGINHAAPYIETELENGVLGLYPVNGGARPLRRGGRTWSSSTTSTWPWSRTSAG